jgi:serine/threonine protein kinase
MPLSPGEQLGPYEIVAPIGAGGMGEVYKARDTRLDRVVALKVSKAEFSERFEREARAVAALNHPNICTLHDVGRNYLVMEYIEGTPLKGPLPVDQALKYAAQICESLDAAHKKNIIHRDLKPANILVTKAGIKLLDFGLAKLGTSGIGQAPKSLDDATLSMALTGKNEIVGTLYYMSPEQLQAQATGQEIDGRSDIFSFGLVLYEMLTGKRAFEGSSPASVIAAIMERPAPSIAGVASPGLDRVLRKCLAKDPDERWQSARDLKDELEWVSTKPAAGPEPVAATSGSRVQTWLWPAAAAIFAVIALLALFRPSLFRPQPKATGAIQNIALSIAPPSATGILPVGLNTATPEISPDGSAVLYHSAAEALLLRRLDSVTPQPVLGMEGKVNPASWAADSKSVFFATSTSVKRMRLPDGAPETLAAISEPLHGFSEASDGTILFAGVNKLYAIVPGREAKPLEMPGIAKGAGFRWPEFLPGSKDFLVVQELAEGLENEIYMATLGEGTLSNKVLLMKNQTMARYTPSGGGRVLFVRNDNLYAQRLNREARRLEGEPELLEQGVASSPEWALAHFSVSRAGVIAWRPGRAFYSQVTLFDRQGKQIGTAGPPGIFRTLELSPDGTRLLANGATVLEPNQPGSLKLRDIDLNPTTLGALWSADGAHLLLARDGRILEHPLGGGQDRELAKAPGILRMEDVSRDGKWALYSRGAMTDAFYAARLDGIAPDPKPVLQTGQTVINPRFSPDGRWIAYGELAGDNLNISLYVQPFPGPGLRQQIAKNGNHPMWRKDGKEIIYFTDDSVWSVPMDTAGAQPRASTPQLLFHTGPMAQGLTDANQMAVSADGSRFYLPLTATQPDSGLIHIRMGNGN